MSRKTASQIIPRSCRWLVATRSRRRIIIRILIVLLLGPVLLQWALAYLLGGDARLLPHELQHAHSILFVTAHPDDECLFFAPSILGVLERDHNIRGGLLVMSVGNNYGIGEKRKQELKGSCDALGIDPSRCVALDHPKLQDNPTVWWDTALIQSILEDYVRKWDVSAVSLMHLGVSSHWANIDLFKIVTFDENGVSGHINHRAVSAAVKYVHFHGCSFDYSMPQTPAYGYGCF
ncbi:N-acetylglucosaminyl-phosphatidylinositol de-N-acetylase [Colletotrichum spaethianum]|uniref:N-acetylglucosaminylphosphatidylinositol deacetylase n=1 Tax=Colletotrichum spaethianum TaxID=700344 RepID=A0AA37LEU9_9PEZI|nr:N-acetylglucosaminyl-phosphatidylinositol de-N-acetylase [Colletotrichum spaethianum]GKT46119.1 N-acetylglucosaminyl-phosphatidylinositol de-N-acetylase [Colletotrichum spaethianum]